MTRGRATPPRVLRRMEETRERLLRSALALFAEKGFEATTVADITSHADVGKGTFFTHFPTKEAVVQDFGGRIQEAIFLRLGEAARANAPVRERILEVFVALADWHQEDHELSRLFVDAVFRSFAVVAADAPARDRLLQAMVSLVKEGQRRGELAAGSDAVEGAMILTGAYFGVFFQWDMARRAGASPGRPIPDLTGLLRRAIDAVLRGLE